jgi:hypothetical protein
VFLHPRPIAGHDGHPRTLIPGLNCRIGKVHRDREAVAGTPVQGIVHQPGWRVGTGTEADIRPYTSGVVFIGQWPRGEAVGIHQQTGPVALQAAEHIQLQLQVPGTIPVVQPLSALLRRLRSARRRVGLSRVSRAIAGTWVPAWGA